MPGYVAGFSYVEKHHIVGGSFVVFGQVFDCPGDTGFGAGPYPAHRRYFRDEVPSGAFDAGNAVLGR